MAKIIGLPKLSPTMEEGTLAAWVKKEGDAVDIDDLLAEVETDKATMEFRSFDRGVLLKILVPAGETLAPDTPVAIIGKAGEDISALLAEVASQGSQASTQAAPAPAPAPASAPVPVNTPPAPMPAHASSAVHEMTQRAVRREGERVLSSPLVRRMAREHDIELRAVIGTGPKGRIIKRDVESFLASGAASAQAVSQSASRGARRGPEIVKASQMRKTIARRLTESKQTVPHFYLTIDVDAGPLWDARKKMNEALKKQERKVSLNDLIIKACAVALRRVPAVNASWAGDAIHYHQVVDISVAVSVPDGLMTPVVRDADVLGVLEINEKVRDLAKRAREKKLALDEMQNGTFSISNLGMYGIEEFAAVINPPEGALIAIGTVREEPVLKDGQVVPGRRMKMTLSCDHRVVDGAIGAQYLAALKKLIEAPLNMLL